MKNTILDFISLTKPKLISLVLMTTLAGFYIGSNGSLNLDLMAVTLIGTILVAAGALVLNQHIEREIDGVMKRTCNRPLPDGRLKPRDAMIFGIVLSVAGLYINFVIHRVR